MHRFDSQHELESHALGRSLLAMLADEGGCFESAPEEAPIAARPSPFDSVRERLAAAASTIRHLEVQAYLLACPSAVFEFYTGCFDILFRTRNHGQISGFTVDMFGSFNFK